MAQTASNILDNASRHADTVPMATIRQATVLGEQTLRDDQHEHHGRTLTQVQVQVGDQPLTWFVMGYWWADFDDAGDDAYVYESRDLAQRMYDRHSLSAAVSALEPPTMTGCFKRPGHEDYHVTNLILHQGKVAGYNGEGFSPKAYFSTVKTAAAGFTKAAVQAAIDANQAWSTPALVACMITPGDNGEGTFMELSAPQVTFHAHHCWETGRNFFELRNRLPEDVFKQLVAQAGLYYHKEQEEEEGNWKGWASLDQQGLHHVITANGYTTRLG